MALSDNSIPPTGNSIPHSDNPNSPTTNSIPSTGNPISSGESTGIVTVPSPMVFLNLPIHTKLSRTNFLAWKSQIEPLLHAYGLISFIASPPLPPTLLNPTNGQVQLNTAYPSWYKQDQMILAWLHASLSEPILAQVVSCSTSIELWHNLLQTFSASSRARLTELKKNLQTTVKGGKSCFEFLQQIRAISDELAFVGSPVADEDLVLTVLGGLGSDYNAFVVAVNSRKDPITFIEVQSLLLSMRPFSRLSFHNHPHCLLHPTRQPSMHKINRVPLDLVICTAIPGNLGPGDPIPGHLTIQSVQDFLVLCLFCQRLLLMSLDHDFLLMVAYSTKQKRVRFATSVAILRGAAGTGVTCGTVMTLI